MEYEEGKVFVGGLSRETTEEGMKKHFERYGDVLDAMIMKDRHTGRSRGFGFVFYFDSAVADRVVQEKHVIDGRLVEAKKATPRDDQVGIIDGMGPVLQTRTKLFIGGLASNVTETDFREYFQQFGTVLDAVVMHDQATQRPRGFGFVTYGLEDVVDKVMAKTFHELKGKLVEVKRAIPREHCTFTSRASASGLRIAMKRRLNFACNYFGHGVGMNLMGASNSGGTGVFLPYGTHNADHSQIGGVCWPRVFANPNGCTRVFGGNPSGGRRVWGNGVIGFGDCSGSDMCCLNEVQTWDSMATVAGHRFRAAKSFYSSDASSGYTNMREGSVYGIKDPHLTLNPFESRRALSMDYGINNTFADYGGPLIERGRPPETGIGVISSKLW